MVASNEWGHVNDDGAVYVRTSEGERAIGSWQAGDPAEGLAHYTRRYEDLATEVTLLEKRLESGAGDPKHTAELAATLKVTLPTASVIGDLKGLNSRLEKLAEKANVKISEASAAKTQARNDAISAKEKLAAEAEVLAASTQWKSSGDRLRGIVDEWKLIKGVDRKNDDLLWKRFSAARDAFSKARGAHFAELDRQRETAREAKLAIVAEAEALSASTDWAPTASKMKSLMSKWKAAGRAPRDTEDDLWNKFRAAQDVFFNARGAVLSERDSEQVDNQRAKEALLADADKIDPDADLDKAKAALRGIQDRWEAIGHVPRDVIRSLDERLREVEERVRDAEDDKWHQSSADSNPLLINLRDAVSKAEHVLAKAKTVGNDRKIVEAEQTLAAKREWLVEAEKSVRR